MEPGAAKEVKRVRAGSERSCPACLGAAAGQKSSDDDNKTPSWCLVSSPALLCKWGKGGRRGTETSRFSVPPNRFNVTGAERFLCPPPPIVRLLSGEGALLRLRRERTKQVPVGVGFFALFTWPLLCAPTKRGGQSFVILCFVIPIYDTRLLSSFSHGHPRVKR